MEQPLTRCLAIYPISQKILSYLPDADVERLFGFLQELNCTLEQLCRRLTRPMFDKARTDHQSRFSVIVRETIFDAIVKAYTNLHNPELFECVRCLRTCKYYRRFCAEAYSSLEEESVGFNALRSNASPIGILRIYDNKISNAAFSKLADEITKEFNASMAKRIVNYSFRTTAVIVKPKTLKNEASVSVRLSSPNTFLKYNVHVIYMKQTLSDSHINFNMCLPRPLHFYRQTIHYAKCVLRPYSQYGLPLINEQLVFLQCFCNMDKLRWCVTNDDRETFEQRNEKAIYQLIRTTLDIMQRKNKNKPLFHYYSIFRHDQNETLRKCYMNRRHWPGSPPTRPVLCTVARNHWLLCSQKIHSMQAILVNMFEWKPIERTENDDERGITNNVYSKQIRLFSKTPNPLLHRRAPPLI